MHERLGVDQDQMLACGDQVVAVTIGARERVDKAEKHSGALVEADDLIRPPDTPRDPPIRPSRIRDAPRA